MNIGLSKLDHQLTCTVYILFFYWSNCKSNFPVVKYGPLHYKALQADKRAALQINNNIYNGKAIISPPAINELKWYVSSIQLAYHYLTTHNQTGTLCTKASMLHRLGAEIFIVTETQE